MDHDEGNQGHGGEAMQYVDQSPGLVRQPVGVALPKRRIDPHYQKEALNNGHQDDQGGCVMEQLLRKWVFSGFAG